MAGTNMNVHDELERHGVKDRNFAGTFDGSEERELATTIEQIPKPHHALVRRALQLGVMHVEKFYAIAALLRHLRLIQQSNSTVTLYPAVGPGVNVASGAVQQMFPMQGGVITTTPFAFSEGMFFQGVTTHDVDAIAGWHIVGQSFKFSDDPLAGVFQDTAFAAFVAELTSGPGERLPLGVYSHRVFLSTTVLNCSAVLRALAPAPMQQGITVSYIDTRCVRMSTRTMDNFEPYEFASEVATIMGRRHRGLGPHELFGSLLPR